MKKVFMFVVAFISLFIVTGKASAAADFDNCLKDGHSKDVCIDECYTLKETSGNSFSIEYDLDKILVYMYKENGLNPGAFDARDWVIAMTEKVCIDDESGTELECFEIPNSSIDIGQFNIADLEFHNYVDSLSSGRYFVHLYRHDGKENYTHPFSHVGANGVDPTQNTEHVNETTTENTNFHCYKYFHEQSFTTPAYNTTLWSNTNPGCGFEITTWTKDQCMDADLNNTSFSYSKGNVAKITRSGYNGVADFYTRGTSDIVELKCQNFRALHIIYRVAILAAPIITVFFVTFDLVKSIISGDEKKVAAFRNKLIRRLIALFLLIVIPIIISVLTNTLSKNGVIKDSSLLKCIVSGEVSGSDTQLN